MQLATRMRNSKKDSLCTEIGWVRGRTFRYGGRLGYRNTQIYTLILVLFLYITGFIREEKGRRDNEVPMGVHEGPSKTFIPV